MTAWVYCSASPVASTNQFLIEDISHVIKETKCIESTSDKIRKQNNNHESREEKHAHLPVGGVSYWRDKR